MSYFDDLIDASLIQRELSVRGKTVPTWWKPLTAGQRVELLRGQVVKSNGESASVVSWSLSATGTTGTLTAKVSKADTFRLTQQDLKFRVRRQTGTSWEWPIDSLHIADQTITATVRLQE